MEQSVKLYSIVISSKVVSPPPRKETRQTTAITPTVIKCDHNPSQLRFEGFLLGALLVIIFVFWSGNSDEEKPSRRQDWW